MRPGGGIIFKPCSVPCGSWYKMDSIYACALSIISCHPPKFNLYIHLSIYLLIYLFIISNSQLLFYEYVRTFAGLFCCLNGRLVYSSQKKSNINNNKKQANKTVPITSRCLVYEYASCCKKKDSKRPS